jgi:hypothetical protein
VRVTISGVQQWRWTGGWSTFGTTTFILFSLEQVNTGTPIVYDAARIEREYAYTFNVEQSVLLNSLTT